MHPDHQQVQEANRKDTEKAAKKSDQTTPMEDELDSIDSDTIDSARLIRDLSATTVDRLDPL